MKNIEQHVHIGLDNVVIADTEICYIDGEVGKLFYRGYNIDALAQYSSYEEVVYLMLFNKLPTSRELSAFRDQLAERRPLDPAFLNALATFPRDADPMDNLRTAISLLGAFHGCLADQPTAMNREWGIDIVAKCPAIVAVLHRLSQGLPPLAPKPGLTGTADSFLYMLNGETPEPLAAKALDRDLLLHAEHGLAASTVSARLTVSTMSDVFAALSAAIGTLKGPLHGGAAAGVFSMLKDIGSVDRVSGYVHEVLARKEKIPGFGHRVYKTTDPRAVHLKEMARQLADQTGGSLYFDIAEKLVEVTIPLTEAKGVFPNVDLYSGLIYDCIGIPEKLVNSVFAISRTAGWVAHVLEQMSNNRLIRPRERYTGLLDLPYVAIENRV